MLSIIKADILKADVCAIVNPANVSLLAGSGLCGAIHKSAGPELEVYCKSIGKQDYGSAVISPAFGLNNSKHIIHACGPRWIDGQRGEAEILSQTHRSIIKIALKHELKSIAIPAISTGIYRFPSLIAAGVAISTVLNEIDGSELNVNIVVNEPDKYQIYKSVLEEINENK